MAIDLLSEAEMYIHRGLKPIPVNENKKPTIDAWTPLRDIPNIPLEQIKKWLGNPSAVRMAILLDRSCFALDYDGLGENRLRSRILPRCPEEIQEAYEVTARTRTPNGGHALFRINPQDFPDGIREIECWSLLSDNITHNQVLLLSQNKYLVERGTGYEPINDIESMVVLSKDIVTKTLIAFNRSKEETDVISQTIRALLPYYKDGNRDKTVFAVSGYLHKYGVPRNLIRDTVEDLMDLTGNDTLDEREERFNVVSNTCNKDPKSDEVSGRDKLLEAVKGDDSILLTLQKAYSILGYFRCGNGEEVQQKAKKDDDDDDNLADQLLDLVLENLHDLFKDQVNNPFAAIRVNGHIETLPITSTGNNKFKMWMYKTWYERVGAVLSNAEALNAVCNVLRARAIFDSESKILDLRVSNGPDCDDGKVIYYDLTNKDWQVVKITQSGWTIKESINIPTIFRRFQNQKSQVTPSRVYSPDIFDRFMDLINIGPNRATRLLLKCYIVSLFIPKISKPVLMLHGPEGAAKTACQTLIKNTCDPSVVSTLTFPRDINELVQQLSHNYVPYYDNVSIIPNWLSDALCRAVTGTGFSKRELYTDDDDIIYQFIRCLGFNGINMAATKSDLLDRGIIIGLERIDNKKIKIREFEGEILPEYERLKPKLLGYIFDILARVLHVKANGDIELKARSRMADFEKHAEIISQCMGYEPMEFINAYHENKKLRTDNVLEGSPVAKAIIEFMETRKVWNGSSSILLSELEEVAEKLKINIHKEKLWPKAAHSLTRRLNEIKSNLEELDISLITKRHPIKRTVIIEISKEISNSGNSRNTGTVLPTNTGEPDQIRKISFAPFEAFENEKSSSNDPSNLKGIPGGSQNHAQNDESKYMMASKDIFRCSTTNQTSDIVVCKYCELLGYKISFDTLDLLERHVIQKHPGWTAYPGSPDLMKYKQVRGKGVDNL